MKQGLSLKLLRAIGTVVATVVILAAVFLYLIKFSTPYLQQHRVLIANWASKLMHQPIKVESIAVDRTGASPEIQLHGVTVFDDSGKKVIAKVDDLYVAINVIKSLLNWSLEPSEILVSGAKLNLVQRQDLNLRDFNKSSPKTQQLCEWLFSQGKIYLQNVQINWQTVNGKHIVFTNLRIELLNHLNRHKVIVLGVVSQPALAWFHCVLNLDGLLQAKTIKADGYLGVTNFALPAWSRNFDLFGMKAAKGAADLRAWFKWQAGQLKQLHTLLTIRNGKFLLPNKQQLSLDHLEANNILLPTVNGWQLDGNYHNVIFNYNKLFRQPLTIDQMQNSVDFATNSSGRIITISNLQIDNRDISLRGHIAAMLPASHKSPVLNINTNYSVSNIAAIAKYYPASIMSHNLLNWLDHAFPAGKAIDGRLQLQGDLADFPYLNNRGTFAITNTLHDITLNHTPKWPYIKHINGSMDFIKNSMVINAVGKIADIPLNNIVVKIADLSKPILTAVGHAACDNKQALFLVQNSPLQQKIGQYFSQLQLSGPMRLQIALKVPLGMMPGSVSTSGKITEQNSQLAIPSWHINFNKIKGALFFTDKALSSPGLKAQLFGQPVTVTLHTLDANSAHPTTRIAMHGNMTTHALGRVVDFPLENYLQGGFTYHAILNLAANGQLTPSNFNFWTNMQGVTVRLPAPFTKLTDTVREFSLGVLFESHNVVRLNLQYGKQLRSLLRLRRVNNKTKLLNGVIHVGKDIPMLSDRSGLQLTGSLPIFNWSDWQDFVAHLPNTGNQLLTSIDMHFGAIYAWSQRFTDAAINGFEQSGKWLLHITSDQAVGDVAIPMSEDKLPIEAKFSKLYLQSHKHKSLKWHPEKIPALHLVANDLHYEKYTFQSLELQLEPHIHGLNINKLNILNRSFDLSATGKWRQSNGENYTKLYGTFRAADLGALLQHWQKSNSLEGGKGKMVFSLSWPDVPTNPSTKTVSGNLVMNFADGRIINLGKKTEAELGLGRVLNLFSLQSLPRRLTLNFSDLTQKGFAFDTLKGEVKLANGNAYTDDLALEGSVAHIAIAGRIGVVQKDYDIVLTMIPYVTSSLPVLVTLAGGPIAGAVTWAADELFKHTLQKATAYKYKVTGSWQKPNIAKLIGH